MFSKFSHDLKQALPSSTSAQSSPATTSMTALSANRRHHPTTSNSSFLTSPSLTENTSTQSVGERKEEGDPYEGKYHEETTTYEEKYQREDAKQHPPVMDKSTASETGEEVQWKKWLSCQQLFFVL